MKLSQYISELTELYEKHGDGLILLQAKDAEGNGYNRVHYSPSECYIPKSEMNDHVIEGIIIGPDPEDTREEFLSSNCIDEEELNDDYVLGILL